MSRKQFYSHLIELETLHAELDDLKISEAEKNHLKSLIESNIHHAILDAVLSELPSKDKEYFLEHMIQENHDKVWEHLNNKIENIEDKIKKTADDLKEDIRRDIRETKKEDSHQ